ncbi:MAG: DUF4982 domain-containing protein [Eggerthellaceae bacterium]|nr:DUF4982 domain-containing protein [Eggerthellaceae bacterium]
MKRNAFCEGWEFSRDDGPFEAVVVPHDAMLGNRRGSDAPAGSASGYFFGAAYRYRKRFALTAEQASGAVLLEFEGVYRDARITVNGTPVDAPPYGFIPFFADCTGLVHEGENLIEVACSNADQPDCRWYSGAGIYRPVWLWTGGEARILPEGIRVTTLSTDPAQVRVDVDCTMGAPRISISDESGTVVAKSEGRSAVIAIPDAQLWSAEHPHLYRCDAELHDDSAVVDTATCAFGIRTLEWNTSGLFVNGRETLLRGGCIHCDNGILGAATFKTSELRRMRIMKEAGFNAVRVAHNPAPSTLLEACDEVGMYVMDETWDTWYTRKSAYDYSHHFLDWCDHDLARLVAHDYNHPSVIIYSIGNEVADPIKRQGVELEGSLVSLLHTLDPTRPVTCGLNLTMMVMERAGSTWYGENNDVAEAATASGAPRGSLLFNLVAQASGTGMTMLANTPGADALVSPALDALDIAGYNYAAARYAVDARKHPQRIIVGSETFPHELDKNWDKVKRLPNLVGDFMWAGWDYLGEAGAGSWAYTADEAGFSKPWPWLLAGSGALDIFGQPNAHAALAGAVWNTATAPSIQVRPVNRMSGRTYKATWRGSDAIPSWSWAGCEGVRTQVEVYDGQARSIRLELNGEVVDQRPLKRFVAKFSVEYQPGTLTAVALDASGREIARSSLVSARGPFHLSAKPETKTAHAGDIAYVPVTIEGVNGIVESNADETLSVHVEGCALLGFGSAQPAPTESYLSGTFTTYRGRAMAVVYSAEPGMAKVTVEGTTLGTVTAVVEWDDGGRANCPT